MSLFNNSSRQLRRITEQSISMLKVSQNINTIQHLSFLPSKKSKTYHGRYEKYTTIKNIWHFWYNSQAFILYESQLFVFFQTKVLFIGKKFPYRQKNTFHSQHEKLNTKTIMCSSWSKRYTSSTNLLFPEKL